MTYAEQCPGTDAYEEKSLRARLEIHETIYLGRPASKAAAQRLRLKGEIVIQDGTGRDAGLWLARRALAGGRFVFRDDGGVA